MNICYLVGAGDFFGMPTPDSTDLVIAADGGYDALMRHGVPCDEIIGDLDSINERPSRSGVSVYPKEKDETDMFLALSRGIERGYTRFEIYGGTGGRQDHTMANYSLLVYGAKRGLKLRMHSESGFVTAVSASDITLLGECGDLFSVFAFGGDAVGVDITGAKYSLTDGSLSPDFPLGVSNEFAGECVRVSVREGNLLIFSKGKR